MTETDKPSEEIKPALEVIGTVLEKFETVSEVFEPIDKTFGDNVYVTISFDPLSHFELDTDNVIDLYEKITKTKLDMELEEEKEGEDKGETNQ